MLHLWQHSGSRGWKDQTCSEMLDPEDSHSPGYFSSATIALRMGVLMQTVHAKRSCLCAVVTSPEEGGDCMPTPRMARAMSHENS